MIPAVRVSLIPSGSLLLSWQCILAQQTTVMAVAAMLNSVLAQRTHPGRLPLGMILGMLQRQGLKVLHMRS